MKPWISLAITLVLSGCLMEGPAASDDRPGLPDVSPGQQIYVFDGVFAPSGGSTQTFRFEVPNGSMEVEGLLLWDAPAGGLSFVLYGPDGDEAARGWHERDGRAYVTTTHDPAPGEWVVQVDADAEANLPFTMSVAVRPVASTIERLETTFTVPPRNPGREVPSELAPLGGSVYGAGERDFAEINLNMKPGDWFNFSWSAEGELYFNVHYHSADGTTDRPIEERSDSLAGNFTANLTEVYALLWRNESAEPVTVTVQTEGRFRLHSMSRDT